MNESIKYEYSVYPRFKETDAYGIINHANYLSYIEEAKIAFLHDKKLLDSNVIDESGGMFPVRDLSIKYLKSITYEIGVPIIVKLNFSLKDSFKLICKFNLYYRNEKVARGEISNIYVNSKGELQSSFPEKLIENYLKLLNESNYDLEKGGV